MKSAPVKEKSAKEKRIEASIDRWENEGGNVFAAAVTSYVPSAAIYKASGGKFIVSVARYKASGGK